MVAGGFGKMWSKCDFGPRRLLVERLAVDVREAARLTSLSARTIRRHIKMGKIRVVRIGRRVLVNFESLKAIFIEQSEKNN
jgi:excisionase family DNA binding protein